MADADLREAWPGAAGERLKAGDIIGRAIAVSREGTLRARGGSPYKREKAPQTVRERAALLSDEKAVA